MNKKTLLNFWLLLLCMIVGGASSSWGQVTIWSEDFSGYSADDVPSGTISLPHTGTSLNASGTLTYGCSNGAGTTKIYDAKLAGGESPELLVAKTNGTFTATFPLDNISGTITLKYKQNANALSVTMTAGKLSSNQSNSTTGEKTLTLDNVTTLHTSLTIEFKATSKNCRLDDIVLTGYKADVAITSIAFSTPKTASVAVGGTTTLTPTVLPANHTEAVDWESDATGVATVSSAGVVTGVAAGTAHIKAKSHDNPTTIYDECTVTVTAPVAVTGVSLKSSTTLLLGGTETLEATILPNDATNKNVTWSSADVTKVSVDEDGVITGLALTNGSPVDITVTTDDGDFEATCAVTVNPVPVSSVTLDKSSATLKVGKTLTLEATVSPDNATDKSVTWESDDEDVATVDDGEVTAVAAGTAKITVKSFADPTKKAECTITVTDGAIDLDSTGEIEITSFPSFSGTGYKSANPYTIGDYEWKATDCMLSSSNLQMKASTGKLVSPTIKCSKGFTVTVTVSTNSVTVSDGTSSASTDNGSATLTTTKTSTTITISAGSSYAQVSKIKITPSKDPIATGVSITDPGTLAAGATGTFSASSTDADECTKAWSSNNSSVITITNASTGAYTATGRGTAKITYTITPEDTENYSSVSAERTVSVTAPVVITASDVAMIYGDAAKAIGATTSAEYAGTLTYESGNTAVATVDASGKVTAIAAGTATITISAPADAEHLYTAGDDKVINVTVSAPAGSGTAAEYTQTAKEYEALTSAATDWTYTEWTTSASYGACSTAGTAGTLKTKDYLIPDKANPCVFFEHTGKTFSDPSTACKLYVQEGSNTPVELSIPKYFKGDKYDNPYIKSGDIDISDYIGKTVHFIFDYNPSTDNEGKWEVKNFGIYYDAFGVKLNASGYATYCSQYPLDFSKENAEDKGFTAWQVTDVSSETITFSQITSGIKGGQGIFLKGSPNAVVTLTSADSSEELDDNLFIGTTAPTYLTQVNGDYTNFALSATYSDFRKIKTGIVPANKAYLPVLTSVISGGSARLAIIFDDDQTTTIQGVSVRKTAPDTYYNLKGQRVDNPKKGGIYVKNGKKVIFK